MSTFYYKSLGISHYLWYTYDLYSEDIDTRNYQSPSTCIPSLNTIQPPPHYLCFSLVCLFKHRCWEWSHLVTLLTFKRVTTFDILLSINFWWLSVSNATNRTCGCACSMPGQHIDARTSTWMWCTCRRYSMISSDCGASDCATFCLRILSGYFLLGGKLVNILNITICI